MQVTPSGGKEKSLRLGPLSLRTTIHHWPITGLNCIPQAFVSLVQNWIFGKLRNETKGHFLITNGKQMNL